jgi:hypothetical protein
MRSSALTIALCMAFLSAGCGTDAQLQAPTALPTAPIALNAPAEFWDLTTTLGAVTGPDCLTGGQTPGSSNDWLLEVRRNGSAIMLLYGNWDDPIQLQGSIDGNAFTAASIVMPPAGSLLCDATGIRYDFQSQVAGHFVADDRELSARETWTYRSGTLEPLVLTFDWKATRR